MAEISQLTTASEQALADLNGLVAALRRESETKGTFLELKKILDNEQTAVFVAKDREKIVGAAFLFIAQKIGKCIGYVEDVIVSDKCRGQGLGKGLMSAVIDEARKRGCTYLHLTSKPDRVAANKLYQKLGFEVVKTNPYKLKL